MGTPVDTRERHAYPLRAHRPGSARRALRAPSRADTSSSPVESDARQRELLLAAGAGKVASVRGLLAQGVRAEPETLAAAVSGAFEPITAGAAVIGTRR